jgi:hypothetical protein
MIAYEKKSNINCITDLSILIEETPEDFVITSSCTIESYQYGKTVHASTTHCKTREEVDKRIEKYLAAGYVYVGGVL